MLVFTTTITKAEHQPDDLQQPYRMEIHRGEDLLLSTLMYQGDLEGELPAEVMDAFLEAFQGGK